MADPFPPCLIFRVKNKGSCFSFFRDTQSWSISLLRSASRAAATLSCCFSQGETRYSVHAFLEGAGNVLSRPLSLEKKRVLSCKRYCTAETHVLTVLLWKRFVYWDCFPWELAIVWISLSHKFTLGQTLVRRTERGNLEQDFLFFPFFPAENFSNRGLIFKTAAAILFLSDWLLKTPLPTQTLSRKIGFRFIIRFTYSIEQHIELFRNYSRTT